MSSEPKAFSVRNSPQLAADLELLQRGGMTASDVFRRAVRLLAQAHEYAERWAQAHDGHRPPVLSVRTADLLGPDAPYDGIDQAV